jgi:hypothetical protein
MARTGPQIRLIATTEALSDDHRKSPGTGLLGPTCQNDDYRRWQTHPLAKQIASLGKVLLVLHAPFDQRW